MDVNIFGEGYWRAFGPWTQISCGWAAVCGSEGSRDCGWSSLTSNRCSSPASEREHLRGPLGRVSGSSALPDCREEKEEERGSLKALQVTLCSDCCIYCEFQGYVINVTTGLFDAKWPNININYKFSCYLPSASLLCRQIYDIDQ